MTLNSTEQYIVETFSTLKMYEKASGSRMNLNKTEDIYIGKWKDKVPTYDQNNQYM